MPLGHERTPPQWDPSSDDEDECLNSFNHYSAMYVPVPLGHEDTRQQPAADIPRNDEHGECFDYSI